MVIGGRPDLWRPARGSEVALATTVRRTVLTLPAGPLGPENPLPALRSLDETHVVDERDRAALPRDMARQIGFRPLSTVLAGTHPRRLRARAHPHRTRRDRHRERPAAGHRAARSRRPRPLPPPQADRPGTPLPQPRSAARRLRAQRRLVLRRNRMEHRRHGPHRAVLRSAPRGPGPRARRRRDGPPLGVGAAARPAVPGGPVAAGGLRLPARRRTDPQSARTHRTGVLVVQHRRPRRRTHPRPRPRRRGLALRVRTDPDPGPGPGVRFRRPDVPAARRIPRRLLLRGARRRPPLDSLARRGRPRARPDIDRSAARPEAVPLGQWRRMGGAGRSG